MPTPPFVPIIGGGFDQVAAQQQYWNAANNAVESQNIQRLNEAQQLGNQYMATLAAQAQRASERDVGMQLEADRVSAAERVRQQELEAQRKYFDWQKQSEKNRLAEESRRTDAMNRRAELAIQAQKEQADQQLEETGKYIAANYPMLKQEYERHKAVYDPLEKEFQQVSDNLAELKDRQAAGEKLTPEDTKSLVELGKRQRALSLQIKSETGKSGEYARAQRAYEKLLSDAEANGFKIRDDTGQVFHTTTGKKWGFRTGREWPPPIAPTPEPETDLPETVPFIPANAGSYFAPTSGTGTTPPPVPPVQPSALWMPPAATPQSFNVGKYRVTTE